MVGGLRLLVQPVAGRPLLLCMLLLAGAVSAATVATTAVDSAGHHYNQQQERTLILQPKASAPTRFVFPRAIIRTIRGGGGGTTDGNSTTTANGVESSNNENNPDGFVLLQDNVLYDNWRKLIRREVQLPYSKLKVNFEIVAQKGTDEAVLVFAWNTKTKTVSLVREYMPSVHRKMMGLAAGMVEDKHMQQENNDEKQEEDRHDVHLTAGKHELEEELRMTGGSWILLTADPCNSEKKVPIAMDKYSTTRLTVYLVIDATQIPHSEEAKPRDETEEGMEVVHGVSVEDLTHLIASGEMTVVGAWASLLALRRLREMGEVN